jgi:hypothetical protein
LPFTADRLAVTPDRDPWTLLPTPLRVMADAGWLTVVYATAVVAIGRDQPHLGPIELGLLVAGGAASVWVGRRAGAAGPWMMLIAILLGGAAGWLTSPAARSALLIDPLAAISVHGAGWIGALAVVRGALVYRAPVGARELERMQAWGLPLLVALWAIGWVIVPPSLSDEFVVSSLWGTLLFVAGGLTSLGLVRLEGLGRGISDSRMRRRMRHLIVAAGLGVLPLSLPFAILSGLPVEQIFAPIIGPLRFLVVLASVPFALLAEALVDLLRPVIAFLLPEAEPASQDPGTAADVAAQAERYPVAEVIGVVLAIAVILALAYLLFEAAGWLLGRRRAEIDFDDAEAGDLERAIVVPATPETPPPRRQGRTQRRRPHDAVGAYVHALDALDRHAAWARTRSETPAHHSSRLRAAAAPGSRELARLAADYQLARYAGRELTRAEDRRALTRLQRLRRLLRMSG